MMGGQSGAAPSSWGMKGLPGQHDPAKGTLPGVEDDSPIQDNLQNSTQAAAGAHLAGPAGQEAGAPHWAASLFPSQCRQPQRPEADLFPGCTASAKPLPPERSSWVQQELGQRGPSWEDESHDPPASFSIILPQLPRAHPPHGPCSEHVSGVRSLSVREHCIQRRESAAQRASLCS